VGIFENDVGVGVGQDICLLAAIDIDIRALWALRAPPAPLERQAEDRTDGHDDKTADDDLPDLVELRLARGKQLAREHRRLVAKLAVAAAERLAASDEPVVASHWEDHDLPFLQEVGKKLVEIAPGRVALLTVGSRGDGAFLVVAGGASGVDLGAVGPEICAILDGRGGGRAPFFQGKAKAVDRREVAVGRLARDVDA